MSDGQVIDPHVLATLRELGGDEDRFFIDVIDLFLDAAPSQLAAIRAALAASDPVGCGLAAHALKSAAANIGAREVASTADALDRLGRSKSLDGVSVLVETLASQLEVAARALRAERERLTPRRE